MERISRTQLYLEIAYSISQRATCERLQVGAVITKDNRIVSTGYNGSIEGAPHCSPEYCDKSLGCQHSIHAEANAIYFAAKHGVPLEGCTLYVTHSPCRKCAEAIINSGIIKVYYSLEYRDQHGIFFLNKNGIDSIKYTTNQHEEKI